MRSLTATPSTETSACVARAEGFLVRRQESDGTWRDFDLDPGPSEAWTTAVVAFALANPPVAPASEPALRRAAAVLHWLRRERGWSYNSHTAVDADTTAWTLRLLAQLHDLREPHAFRLLLGFLDARGAAHTFSGQRFGIWSDAHDDVTPVVGLALLATAPAGFADRVRTAVLSAFAGDPPWRAFWWSSDTYAVARNLEFLEACGGVPASVAASVRSWLDARAPESSFETAQALTCSLAVAPGSAAQLVSRLAALQLADGSWPAEPVLLVPSQHGSGESPAFADENRTFTTACVLLALKAHLAVCPVPKTRSA